MDWQFYFMIVGVATTLYAVFKLLKNILDLVSTFFIQSYPDFKGYGKWAVVTGSTDGIGKALAFELAAKGCDIILLSRNLAKLEAVSQEIRSQHGVDTRHHQIDFTETDDQVYEEVSNFLDGLDVGILVNNVGMQGDDTTYFLDIPETSKRIKDTINVNIYAQVKMTQLILPGMIKRRRGLIINVSSVTSIRPLSRYSVYGATKAFLTYFSQVIRMEYSKYGVQVHTVLPGLVSTNMTKKVPGYKPTAEYFASSMLATVGKQHYTYGCWMHCVVAWLISWSTEKMIVDGMDHVAKKINKTR